MTGKRAILSLIVALLTFGYVFTMNPEMTQFQIYPGARVSTSFALILFLFFLAGFGVALGITAFKEAFRSFAFWRHRKGDQRREQAKELLVQGRGHAVLGRTKTARKLFQRAYRKTSGEPLIALEMARVDLADERFESAERRLKKLLQDDPRSPEVLALLLDLYKRKRDFEGQVATLSRWLEADPNHLGALRSLRDLYRDARNWGEAARVQEKILPLAQGRTARSSERRQLTELRYQEALTPEGGPSRTLLERIAQDDPGFAPAHALLGEALLAAGDREGAVQAWIRGYHGSGQPGLLIRVEEARSEEGRTDEVLKLYRKLGKQGGIPMLLRARLLLRLERSQEALELLEAEQKSTSGSSSALWRLLLAEALYRLRSYDEAARTFRANAFGSEELPLPFSCRTCGGRVRRWSPACPKCHSLDSLELDAGDVAAHPPAPAPS